MAHHGSLWLPKAQYVSQWPPAISYSFQWLLSAIFGPIFISDAHKTQFDPLWHPMAPNGAIGCPLAPKWMPIAPFSFLWLHMAPYDFIWVSLAPNCSRWIQMSSNGSVYPFGSCLLLLAHDCYFWLICAYFCSYLHLLFTYFLILSHMALSTQLDITWNILKHLETT